MELLQNKVLTTRKEERRKERKKERKKKIERRKTILRFRPQAVSNSADTTASVTHHNSFGSTQEYLVSTHISKTNLWVGNIHINHVIYPMRWSFLNVSNPTYSAQYPCWMEVTVFDSKSPGRYYAIFKCTKMKSFDLFLQSVIIKMKILIKMQQLPCSYNATVTNYKLHYLQDWHRYLE